MEDNIKTDVAEIDVVSEYQMDESGSGLFHYEGICYD
jgi:hypothetical protein